MPTALVIGDFNVVLKADNRLEETDIIPAEVTEFQECIDEC